MKRTQLALDWLAINHGWQNDLPTWIYVNGVLRGDAANNFLDQSLIIAAGRAAGYWEGVAVEDTTKDS